MLMNVGSTDVGVPHDRRSRPTPGCHDLSAELDRVLGSGNGAHDCRRPSRHGLAGRLEPREAEQRVGIEEMHQRSFVGRDGPPHRSRRCRRGRGSTSTTGRSASATEPSADVRLDGDQMTADPDDGDAGHVSAASISLRARGRYVLLPDLLSAGSLRPRLGA
jgi:hypothetical protein